MKSPFSAGSSLLTFISYPPNKHSQNLKPFQYFLRSKTFFLLIVVLFVGKTSLQAQNSLSGKVSSDSMNLRGASIYIEDLKIGATTNEQGEFTIDAIPSGTYVIEAHYLGYAMQAKTVNISKQAVVNFKLIRSDYEAQEVVVTGNTVATDLRQTAAPVTEVPHSYLVQNASTNIIDALSKVPGVSGITDGQSISKPVIRGLGYNRVVTVSDGVRQEGQQWGDEFGIEVDQNAVDRVEILKGPASLAYGSDAISGVINLLPEKTLPKGEIAGDILLNYQTNNGLINTMGHVAGNNNGITWSARVSNIMAHAYQNKYDGYVLNSQFQNFSMEYSLGIHRSWGFSELHFSHFLLKTGIVEGERDSATGAFVRQTGFDTVAGAPIYSIATNDELKSYNPFLIKQRVQHDKLVWDNSIHLGNGGRIMGRLAWQRNSREEKNDITIPETSNIFYLLNTFNYDLRYVASTVNNTNFSVGVNGMYQDSKNKGTLLLIPEYNLFDIGGFAIASKKVKKLTLSAGLRYDHRSFKGHDDYVDSSGNQVSAGDANAVHRFASYESNFNGFSGSIGATMDFTKNFYLKANLSKGFRAPNVAESGSNGIHDGTVVYEIGQPNLVPESSVQFDLAPGFSSKDLSVELDFFVNNIQNFIHPVQLKTASGDDSVRSDVVGFPDAPVFEYVQDNALLIGGEAVLDIHPSSLKWLELYTAFSTVDAHLKDVPDSAKYLPFIPPAHLRTELTLSLDHPFKFMSKTYLRFGVYHSFKQTHIYNQTQVYYALPDAEKAASLAPFDDYTLLNVGLGSDFMVKGRKAFSLYISVDNLADVGYKDYMSRFKYGPVNFNSNPERVGVYNMGRNASFKLIVPFNFSKNKTRDSRKEASERGE